MLTYLAVVHHSRMPFRIEQYRNVDDFKVGADCRSQMVGFNSILVEIKNAMPTHGYNNRKNSLQTIRRSSIIHLIIGSKCEGVSLGSTYT